jgi:5-amino-6-(5-phospho-D-ribitylamino)uracil phosphatase
MHVYISDLDGTLLDSNQLLTEKTIGILNELIDSGRLNFTIATARSIDSCWPIIKDLNLGLPLIAHNGALVFDPCHGKYLRENVLDAGLTAEIVSTMIRADLQPFVFSYSPLTGNKVYYTGPINLGERIYVEKRLAANDPRFSLVGDASAIPETDAIEVMALDTRDRLAPVCELFRKRPRLFCHLTRDIYSGYYNLEISDALANKKEGTCYLRACLGATKITSFGDNLNDEPMFDASDECYAVANAHPALKAICYGIIGSNDDDSVACFLKDRLG